MRLNIYVLLPFFLACTYGSEAEVEKAPDISRPSPVLQNSYFASFLEDTPSMDKLKGIIPDEEFTEIFSIFGPIKNPHEEFFFIKEQGRGSYGVVYLAVEKATGRSVSIKVLDLLKLPSGNRKRKYQAIKDEDDLRLNVASAMREIVYPRDVLKDCPYVVDIYCTFCHHYRVFIVMEPLHLGCLLANSNLITSPGAIAALLQQFISLLQFLRIRKVMHRDIHPGNILYVLDPNNSAGAMIKLIDFGLAAPYDLRLPLKGRAGHQVYCAPECLDESCEVIHTPAVDLYAAAVLVAQIAANCPLVDRNHQTLLNSNAMPSVELRTLLTACLDPSPRLRPSLSSFSRISCMEHTSQRPFVNFMWTIGKLIEGRKKDLMLFKKLCSTSAQSLDFDVSLACNKLVLEIETLDDLAVNCYIGF